MAEQFIKSVRKTGTSLGISIPKEVAELLGIREGDVARLTIEKVKKNAR